MKRRDKSAGTSFIPLKWKPPPPHHFKMNMALKSFIATNRVSFGIVIRDSNGTVMVLAETSLLSG